MHHKGTETIETEHLILRRFREEDIPYAFHNWTNDEKVIEFLRWPAHHSLEVTEKIIKEWIEQYQHDDFYQWAIILKANHCCEPIGTISVVEQNEALSLMHNGYCIGSRWWHQGITSEAFSAIISFLFHEVHVNRIESQHDPKNPNSGKVMRKCGLQYEGTMRQADISNRGIVDAAMYSLLAEDFSAQEKNNTNKK